MRLARQVALHPRSIAPGVHMSGSGLQPRPCRPGEAVLRETRASSPTAKRAPSAKFTQRSGIVPTTVISRMEVTATRVSNTTAATM